MFYLPVISIPAQVLSTTLAGQRCRLRIYQRSVGLFMDVYVDDVLVIGGVICHNVNLVVRDPYLGFVGDFAFLDQQGADDPYYTGLGTRFLLAYMEAGQLLL
jgi:hypothetical protein